MSGDHLQQTKLGWIPKDWKATNIENARISIIDGDRGQNYPKQDEFSDNGYCLFLNASNVTRSGFKFDSCQFISSEKDKLLRKGRLKRNDLVLTTRGTVGNIAHFDTSIPLTVMRINSGMVILRNENQHVHNSFLYVVLGSSLIQNQIKKIAFGSAQPALTVATIKKLQFPLPPLTEQRRIAEILGAWDEAITLTQRLVEAKQRRKQGLMQRLLTGSLRLPGFEGEWREVRLGDVAKVIMGQSPSSENYNDTGVGVPLIQGNADIENRLTSPRNFTTEITKTCNVGDIILSVRAPVGETALSLHNACIGRGVCAIQATKLDNRFLYQLLLSVEPAWDRYAQGSTFTAINSSDIRQFVLFVPETKDEQRAIAAVLQTADEEIGLLGRKLSALRAQKQGLMQKLLTGEVRVKVEE